MITQPSYTAGGAVWATAAAGTATLTAAKNNRVDGAIAGQTAVTMPSLKLTGSSSLALDAAATLTLNQNNLTTGGTTDGGILLSGGAATISGGTAISSGGSGALVIRVDQSGDVLTLSTPITTTTTGGWTKNGAGTLILTAANTTSSGVGMINEGTVQLSGAGSTIGSTALNLTTRQGTKFDLNGISATTGTFNGAGTITNSSGTAVTFTTAGGDTISFTGLIQDGTGVVNVKRIGTGTGRWVGSNTYTGVTTMAQTGTSRLEISTLANYLSASTIGTGANAGSNAAALVFEGASAATLDYIGQTSVSIDRLFTLNSATASTGGGGISNNSGYNSARVFNNTGAIAFGANATTVAQLLTLAGAATSDSTFFPLLQDNSAATGAAAVDAIQCVAHTARAVARHRQHHRQPDVDLLRVDG